VIGGIGGDFEPALSVVATARNDDHGGNLLGRMQVFLDGLFAQARRHRLALELVLVEWNPVADRPRLGEALRWPQADGYACARIIEVPVERHRRLQHSDRLPLFQMIAKNVGLRRARAPWVLATNVDVLFSDELTAFLASGRLHRRRLYRVERYDVRSEVPGDRPLAEQLEFCRRNLLRINRREGTLDVRTGEWSGFYPHPTWRSRLHEALQDWRLVPVRNRRRLHTNGCGDFTLMARADWEALRGYPEFEMFSFHLDSLLCFSAHHSGVRERLLGDPMRVYHIEHGVGSGWTPKGEKALNERLESARIPQLDPTRLDEWAIQMRREGRGMIFNRDDWGMADVVLPEAVHGT
jgi:hypothetical protein